MTRIFISYRRGDSELFTGRLADHLRSHFGEQGVFHDIDSIPFGVDFRDHIATVIRQCDILLAVIGKSWLTADERGKRRIDDARDFVRIEIESALDAGIIVIPVLAGDADMPDESELPASISKLAYLNAAQIDTGRDFKVHTERLIQGVKTLPILKPPFPAASKPAPSVPAKVVPTPLPVTPPPQAQITPAPVAAPQELRAPEPLTANTPNQAQELPPVAPASAQSAQNANGGVIHDIADGPELIVLPRGAFTMGSPEGVLGIGKVGGDDERPQRRVTIGYPMAVGKYPITFDEWDACVRDGGSNYTPADEGWGRGKRPVINVSWDDAQTYLRWLNRKAGFGEDDPHRYRLLSEAEWEFASRARNQFQWAFGDNEFQLREYAWYFDNSGKQTHPVGEKKPNAFGLFDMYGNVWEWVEDVWHRNYLGSPGNGSAWLTGGDAERRVLRGGAWIVRSERCRSASRLRDVAANRDRCSGFRVARTLE